MIAGAHESIAGGLHKSVERALADGCESLQIFNKSSNRWDAKPLTDDEISRFHSTYERSGLRGLVSHTSYLINIANPDPVKWRKSRDALQTEVERCGRLGIPGLVLHPGSHLKSGETAGIERISRALNDVFAATPGLQTAVLLENTAGTGDNLGVRFEQIARMIEGVEAASRVHVCLDTCHAFAGGYDLSNAGGMERTLDEFDRLIGIDQLRCVHLNDSLKPYNSRRDRHALIGAGEIGTDAFRYLMNDDRLRDVPGILETPPLDDGTDSFPRMLKLLKGMRT